MLGNFSLGNTILIVILAGAVIAGVVVLVRALLSHPRKRRKG